MTPKERLARIKTAINNGGVYRGYTDSIKPFMEDIKAVEEALEEHEELVRDVKRFMEIFNVSDNPKLWEEHNKLVEKLSKVGNK